MDFTNMRRGLEKRGYVVSCFANREEAADHLENTIAGEVLGFGGSATLGDLGLYERLGKNNAVYWHMVRAEDRDRYAEFTAYLTSVNAAAETGELVNIDNTGNRLAGTLFGPKKVYFVIGRNKITPDLASAIERARNVASPLNCKRMNRATPCVKDGRCHECSSPQRLCRSLTVHWLPMQGKERSEVVLIDEDLGF